MSASSSGEVAGVPNAVNAIAISDDARRAFLLDPRVDAIIAVNLNDGTRQIYKW
jgi:hypothetical protein